MNRSEPQGGDIGGDTQMDTPSLLQRVLVRYTLEISHGYSEYWILKTEGLEKGISCVLVRHKCWSTAPVDLIPTGYIVLAKMPLIGISISPNSQPWGAIWSY